MRDADSTRTPGSALENDPRAHSHEVEQVCDILIVQAVASIRLRIVDIAWVVGAVDAVVGNRQIQGVGAQGVLARGASRREIPVHTVLIACRHPGRIAALIGDVRDADLLQSSASDPDREFKGEIRIDKVVELALAVAQRIEPCGYFRPNDRRAGAGRLPSRSRSKWGAAAAY